MVAVGVGGSWGPRLMVGEGVGAGDGISVAAGAAVIGGRVGVGCGEAVGGTAELHAIAVSVTERKAARAACRLPAIANR
jgi:hypothetical protein